MSHTDKTCHDQKRPTKREWRSHQDVSQKKIIKLQKQLKIEKSDKKKLMHDTKKALPNKEIKKISKEILDERYSLDRDHRNG